MKRFKKVEGVLVRVYDADANAYNDDDMAPSRIPRPSHMRSRLRADAHRRKGVTEILKALELLGITPTEAELRVIDPFGVGKRRKRTREEIERDRIAWEQEKKDRKRVGIEKRRNMQWVRMKT